MKISKLFHWLYAIIMLLPIAVIPVFAIYSHRHTIDNYAIEVPQNEVVDFNQYFNYGGDFQASGNGATTWVVDTEQLTLSLSVNDTNTLYYSSVEYTSYTLTKGHVYVFSNRLKEGTPSAYGGIKVNTDNYQSYVDSSNPYARFRFTYNVGVIQIVFGLEGNPTLTDTDYATFTDICIFDLTQMFGSGNEPTLEQFNIYFPNDSYRYVNSEKYLVKNVGTITYNDTDIGSQMLYSFYNSTDKYFALNKLFGLGSLYDWFLLNMFGGNCPLGFTIFWNLLTYWLIISIFWLLFDVMIYVPQLVHRWLDKGVIE